MENLKDIKDKALAKLQRAVACSAADLADVDKRLLAYMLGVAESPQWHNVYEVLAALKFVRIFKEYPFDAKVVRKAMRMYEGRVDEKGRHIDGSGGLRMPGLDGLTYYPLTPIQVYMIAGTLGPQTYVDGDDRPRRLITEADFFIPRKFGKTTLGAFFQFFGFFCGDYNSEGYCCANSGAQSSILFNMTKRMIMQLDPDGRRIRFTQREINWKEGGQRASKIVALSAGGKTKDGLCAQFCSSDEYGNAGYVRGHSDMASLVNVVEGSMGPRREPLTIHTTTAGTVNNGPYFQKLEGIKSVLRGEVFGESEYNRTFAVLLQPDEWETDEERLFSDRNIWRKVNPHIGITVQPDFYEREIEAARKDNEKKKEVITKLFNVWQCDRVEQWLPSLVVQQKQINRRIDDLDSDDGWRVFVGLDFSMGDDLHAMSYLCVNYDTFEYFADCDAWISEAAMNKSTIRPLLQKWIDDGWLRLSHGAVLQPDLPVARIVELSEKLVFMRFGYDPHLAKYPINTLSAWLLEQGVNPTDYVVPVRQNFANYTSAVGELDMFVKDDNFNFHFSNSPLWPWQFGNCVLAVSPDGMENRKPMKANPGADGCKVDNIQCLCNAIKLWEQIEGEVR